MHDEGSSNKGAVPVKLPSNDELSGHRIPDKMFDAVPTMLFRIVCLSGNNRMLNAVRTPCQSKS